MEFVEWMLGVATADAGSRFVSKYCPLGTRDCVLALQFLSCLNHVDLATIEPAVFSDLPSRPQSDRRVAISSGQFAESHVTVP